MTPSAPAGKIRSLPRLVRASAGTGKTYQLSNRFLELLFAGEAPERILATTFTRKAAGEILSRILLRLAEATADAAARNELAAALKRESLSQAECQQLLVQTLRNMHTLRVSTLDAFFMELAGSYSLELNLPPGWSIGEVWEDETLRRAAINDLLDGQELQDLMTLFHLLTKGEAERSIHLLIEDLVTNLYEVYQEAPAAAWDKIPPYERLSSAELADLTERLQTLALPKHKKIEESVQKDLAAIAAEQWLLLAEKSYGGAILDEKTTYYGKPITPEIHAVYSDLLAHVRSELVTRLAKQTTATRELLQHFETAYEERKQQRRLLRFQDVTRRLSSGATARNNRQLFRLNGRIDHLLLDEFQDTSFPQWRVLAPLAESAAQRGSFFCVGDTKQAIYGWRGGDAAIFNTIEQSLSGVQAETLAKSYRSSPVIIDFVNTVFQKLPNHPRLERDERPVRAWCAHFPPHETALRDAPGYVALHVTPEVSEGEDKHRKHLTAVAEHVAELVKIAPNRSIGILCRRNKIVAQLIYLLRKAGVTASEEGGNPLTDSAPVEAILSLLTWVDHPGDSVCRFHVATSPLGKIVGLREEDDSRSAERITQQLRREIAFRGLGPVCLQWSRQLAVVCNERDRNRLQQLVELAYDFSPNSLRLTDFVEFIRQARVPDPAAVAVRVMTIHQAKGLEFDFVVLPELDFNLMGQSPNFVTRRASASEPIDLVCRYIGQAARRLLPEDLQQVFTTQREEKVEETLCLLYVALTRAAHALHLFLPPSSPTERSIPRDVAGLLRFALLGDQALAADSIPFELGDRDWFRQLKKEEKATEPLVSPAVSTPSNASAVIKLQPPLKQHSRGWQRVVPSQLEGGTSVAWDTLFGQKHGGDFCRGTLFHAWLELIEWLDEGEPTRAMLLAQARKIAPRIGPLLDHLDPLTGEFLQMLKRPQLNGLLRRSFYTSVAKPTPVKKTVASLLPQSQLRVEREFPFAIRCEAELIQGLVDRLVLVEDGTQPLAAEIVDFKTDAILPGDSVALAERVAFYRPQMEAYRRSIAQLFQLPLVDVTARLMFVACDECVMINS